MIPSIGRIVHYQSYGTPGGEYMSQPRAAIITDVHKSDPAWVGLAVLNPTGMFFKQDVFYSETGEPGSWTWPPRVEANL